MPAFQVPTAIKRKSEQHDEPSRKRVAVELPSSAPIASIPNASDEFWMVLWYVTIENTLPALNLLHLITFTRRNPQYKKHKTWDGDAVLVASASQAILYDTEGKVYALV